MRLYLDACAIIYSVEGTPSVRSAVLGHIALAGGAAGGVIITSRLSRLECRVLPLRANDTALLGIYEQFFTLHSLALAEITPSVIELATDLRVRRNLKTPDAIHIATAIEPNADLFLTGDHDLVRCTEIKIQLV